MTLKQIMKMNHLKREKCRFVNHYHSRQKPNKLLMPKFPTLKEDSFSTRSMNSCPENFQEKKKSKLARTTLAPHHM
jgi:hypothetical protein